MVPRGECTDRSREGVSKIGLRKHSKRAHRQCWPAAQRPRGYLGGPLLPLPRIVTYRYAGHVSLLQLTACLLTSATRTTATASRTRRPRTQARREYPMASPPPTTAAILRSLGRNASAGSPRDPVAGPRRGGGGTRSGRGDDGVNVLEKARRAMSSLKSYMTEDHAADYIGPSLAHSASLPEIAVESGVRSDGGGGGDDDGGGGGSGGGGGGRPRRGGEGNGAGEAGQGAGRGAGREAGLGRSKGAERGDGGGSSSFRAPAYDFAVVLHNTLEKSKSKEDVDLRLAQREVVADIVDAGVEVTFLDNFGHDGRFLCLLLRASTARLHRELQGPEGGYGGSAEGGSGGAGGGERQYTQYERRGDDPMNQGHHMSAAKLHPKDRLWLLNKIITGDKDDGGAAVTEKGRSVVHAVFPLQDYRLNARFMREFGKKIVLNEWCVCRHSPLSLFPLCLFCLPAGGCWLPAGCPASDCVCLSAYCCLPSLRVYCPPLAPSPGHILTFNAYFTHPPQVCSSHSRVLR